MKEFYFILKYELSLFQNIVLTENMQSDKNNSKKC